MDELMERPKRQKRLGAGTEVARQAFLHGHGDGRPVSSTARLCALAGVSEKTIEAHMPTWIKEREEMLVKFGDSPFGLQVSPETLEIHHQDLNFLRNQADQLKQQIELLPQLIGELKKVLSHLKSGLNKEEFQAASMAFSLFLRTHANVRESNKLLLMLLARWTQHAGIDALSDVALTRQKAMASGKAKLELKREEAAGNGKPGGMESAQIGSRDDVFNVGGGDDWGDMGDI